MKVFISTSVACFLCLHISFGQNRTIVINEFMYDPTPVAGLPDAEYVEILNTNIVTILLSGWTLNDHPIPAITLMPGEFRVLCETSRMDLFDQSIPTLGLASWDRLNNDGQAMVLKDHHSNIVDSLVYDGKWISDPLKNDGGWSLELINPLKICSDKNNWSVSLNLHGGSPGSNNSVFDITPDNSAPRVFHTAWLGADSLQLIFTEIVNFTALDPTDIFIISPGSIPFDMASEGFTNTQIITFQDPLDTGSLYHLRIKNIEDCENNVMNDTLIQIGIGREPYFNDILITELMVDEIPSAGLPESEYIEILNRSDKLLNLSNTYLFDETRTYNLPGLQLFPEDFYILIPESKANLFKNYANLILLEKFPKLNNDGKMLGLYSRPTGLLFLLQYDKNWYKDHNKSEGGYALEMIDFRNPCGGINNWSASFAGSGGTPGEVNSLEIDNPDLSGPEVLRIQVLEEDMISVLFNEKLHPDCFNNLSLLVDNQDMHNLWTYDTLALNAIEVEAPSPKDEKFQYEVKISGARDCVGNIMKNEGSSLTVHVPSIPDIGEVVINEILFNPKPGGVDWIEIYNVSDKYVNVKDWHLSDEIFLVSEKVYPVSEGHFILEPFSFLVLTNDINKMVADFPYTIIEYALEVPNLPAMPDEEGFISIWTSMNQKMDELSYNQDQHNLFLRDTEGVSLERVSPLHPTNDRGNWHSASSQSGYGTPTYRNSQQQMSGDMGFEFTILPPVFSPDQDGYDDFLTISLAHQKPGFFANIYIFDIGGRMVKSLVKGWLLGTRENILWDGFTDNGQLANPGHYILFLEMFHPDGDSYFEKRKIVVGKRF